MMIDKQLFENMKVNYVSNNDGKEYTLTIGHVGFVEDKYLSGSQPYCEYLGIDMVTGEITKEYIEDGIPQPYTAGILTSESLKMLQGMK